MDHILICDFTGLPLQKEEMSALLSASVLYVRQKQSGLVHFSHEYLEGEMEAHGSVSNGALFGERFTVEYEWGGKERAIEFILPPVAQRMAVRKNLVAFRASKGGKRSKRTLH